MTETINIQNRKLQNTRNVSIIAHVDHGKTTLTDCLISRQGLLSKQKSGLARFTDTRKDEKERGITIKSTGVTMDYEFEQDTYTVNLVDSPGHVDFSSEVTAALRVTDSSLVIVDSVEGVSVQTETVLRQSLAERVKPVLIINKLDRHIFELQLTPEESITKINAIIENINSLISIYQEEDSEHDLSVSLDKGNVLLASGLHGWGFTLYDFAKMYAKPGQDLGKLMHTLAKPDNLAKEVITPVFKFARSVMENQTDEYTKMMSKLKLDPLNSEDAQKIPKEKYKLLMQAWLPLSEAVLYCLVNHLPSPIEAQKYRVDVLYDGDLTDACATAIRNCDANGPLMIYISKLIPTDDKGRFFAFGRIFSGTVRAGMKVNIMGANYVPGSKTDFYENKSIQRVSTMIGAKVISVDELTCGNVVALTGIDSYLVKSGTITDCANASPIKSMKFSVSPVVRVAIQAKNPSDIAKLVEGLKKLSKSDPCVQCYTEETGEHIIAGVGELHIEICLNDLREYVGADIKVSDPVVPLRESVSSLSSVMCLAKSPNKHNRLYMRAEALDPELVDELSNGLITYNMDQKKLTELLVKKYNWDINEAKKIWSWSTADNTNVLVDMTKGVQNLTEIKDSIITSFQVMCDKGVLCEEQLRGVRFNIYDATIHNDNAHRGGGQIEPCARRAMCASQLSAEPIIMEPMYKVEIQVPNTKVSTIYSCIAQKRGRVIDERSTVGSLMSVTAYLPVLESFGFNAYIREATSGQAFPQLMFDHWEVMNGNPLDKDSKVAQIVKDVRKRKNPGNAKAEEIPPLEYYMDKL